MGSDETQHMRHVVHNGAVDAGAVHHGSTLRDGLPVEGHAFSQNDQFGTVFSNNVSAAFDIDLVRVVGQYRKIDHRRLFRLRVSGDIVPQRSHGLRAEVSALYDMVIEDLADSALLCFSIGTVYIIHQRAVYGHVCHLAGDQACLDLTGA